jgi:hypothetical protein
MALDRGGRGFGHFFHNTRRDGGIASVGVSTAVIRRWGCVSHVVIAANS